MLGKLLNTCALRLNIVVGFCLLLLAGCQSSGVAAKKSVSEQQANKPNIIFILTDDQRWDSVGFMGHNLVQTPNLDRLASDGHVFDQGFVTSAICMPSRVCYMLGQYERRHGVNFNSGTSMTPEAWAKSYPVLMRDAGYFTGYIGKNHMPIGDKGYYTGLIQKSFDYWYAGDHHIGFYPKDKHEIFDNAKVDTQAEIITESALDFLDPDSNEAFSKNALNFLARRPADQPFMLSICLNLPHGFSTSGMQQRETDDELYQSAYREYQDTLPLAPHYVAKKDIQDPKLPPNVLLADLRQNGYDWVDQPNTARERMIRVMQAVTGIDRMVGNLRNKLDEMGIAENTVIILSSDHGLFAGEHGLGGKSLCYETNLRVPFVVYDPRIQQGNRSDDLVMSIDVAPTILSMGGVQIPDSVQGQDLTPLLEGDNSQWRDAAFGENLWSTIFGNPRCETVRTKAYRYIRYFKNDNRAVRERTPKKEFYIVTQRAADAYADSLSASIKGEPVVYEELFHTATDPYEAKNLVDDPEHAAVLQEMRARCQQMVAQARGDVNTPPATLRIDYRYAKTNYRKQD